MIFDKTGTLTKGKPAVTDSRIFLTGNSFLSLRSRLAQLVWWKAAESQNLLPYTPATPCRCYNPSLHNGRGRGPPSSCLHPAACTRSTADPYSQPASNAGELPSAGAGFPPQELLHLAAAAEASSEHPLGKAITVHARAALRRRSAEGEHSTGCWKAPCHCIRLPHCGCMAPRGSCECSASAAGSTGHFAARQSPECSALQRHVTAYVSRDRTAHYG